MDENPKINSVTLRGVTSCAPVFSHESRGARFYSFPIEVERLSGAVDRLNVIARQELLSCTELTEGDKLGVYGELRSFNNRSGIGSRLIISVFARSIEMETGEDRNLVELTGTLCKAPTLRTTPMGREICDLMLAVNRRYGRSDYLPCIAWGLLAHSASAWRVGDRIALHGRIRSRQHIKLIDGEQMEKTAFEVSVTDAARV